MPNSPAHIDLAYRTAQVLKHPVLQDYSGYFLLGATAPDIRIITKRSREEYHFVSLNFEAIGDGIKKLFETYPKLGALSPTDMPTKAFIAGYMTHLVADETWITNLYRPYFGNRTVFENEIYGKVMDRALQLELDRQSWPTVDSTIHLIVSATGCVNIGFISAETLAMWRQWITNSLAKGFSWDRIKFMAQRIAGGDNLGFAERLAAEFYDSVDEGLNDIYQKMPGAGLDQYREKTIEFLAHAIGDYLN